MIDFISRYSFKAVFIVPFLFFFCAAQSFNTPDAVAQEEEFEDPSPSSITRTRDTGPAQKNPNQDFNQAAPAPLQQYFEDRLRSRLTEDDGRLPVFGHEIFSGRYSSTLAESRNPNYVIGKGDSITVSLWGAISSIHDLIVDSNGMIFIPEVGPLKVSGIKSENLNEEVQKQISRNFNRNVNVYAHLKGATRVYVFVSGGVVAPGQYEGASSDSLLRFIDRAGGIVPDKGSFRDIRILRNGQIMKRHDLYDFLLNGQVPFFAFKNGDTIHIGPRKSMVSVSGTVLRENRFEMKESPIMGEELMDWTQPLEESTHVQILTREEQERKAKYFQVSKFKSYPVKSGDKIEFISDIGSDIKVITIEGEHSAPQRLIVGEGTKLKEILRLIPVDTTLADTNSIYIKRRSVVAAQKESILESIDRLERSLIGSQITSKEEAEIKQAEAELVRQFIDRAKDVEPEGRVVLVGMDGELNLNLTLEDGDTIVIPRQTDLVRISGEVFTPRAVLHIPGAGVYDYISMAGGFNDRANKDKIVVSRQNGVITTEIPATLRPGDEIIVPPSVTKPSLEIAGTVVDIIYKIALSAAVPLRFLLDND